MVIKETLKVNLKTTVDYLHLVVRLRVVNGAKTKLCPLEFVPKLTEKQVITI